MKQTKLQRTVQLLRKGWTTALDSALAGGCMSLSQRVGELEREGACIARKWVDTKGGARVMAYRWLKPTEWTA
tara:strand:+ start:3749 stop:3967 length:219 start_codon:yes stop_codon:yes gene_type:complete